MHQTWLTSILSVISLYYWNEYNINDQGSDLGHYTLSILCRNATFCLAIDCFGIHFGSQFPSSTQHFSLRSTKNHHVQGLRLNHLIISHASHTNAQRTLCFVITWFRGTCCKLKISPGWCPLVWYGTGRRVRLPSTPCSGCWPVIERGSSWVSGLTVISLYFACF